MGIKLTYDDIKVLANAILKFVQSHKQELGIWFPISINIDAFLDKLSDSTKQQLVQIVNDILDIIDMKVIKL